MNNKLDTASNTGIYVDREVLEQLKTNCDDKAVFLGLGLKAVKITKNKLIAISPFNPSEKHPSFEMYLTKHYWRCFSTNRYGSILDLVSLLQNCDVYESARWIISNGYSGYSKQFKTKGLMSVYGSNKATPSINKGVPDSVSTISSDKGKDFNYRGKNEGNKQAKFDLLRYLRPSHPEFIRRGITKEVCEYLRCGFLQNGRGNIAERLVFQIYGVSVGDGGALSPVLLSHIGRATTEKQLQEAKWWQYEGFHKSNHLYNIDRVLLDERAITQTQALGWVLVVEGCFDVAKLVTANCLNVIATFGASLAVQQIEKLKLIAERLGQETTFLLWFDKDKAGIEGQNKALSLLMETNLKAIGFDWERKFSKDGSLVGFPENVKDPCEFSVEQLKYLRKMKII
jgi:5S rRNA maturation endonuclease (ribonuclease M5)